MAVLAVPAVYFLGLARFMVTESRLGKVRDRDTILEMLPWHGDEQVRDLGFGRRPRMIGAAGRAPTGLGFDQMQIVVLHPVRDRVLGLLTFGSFAPATVLARRV